MGRRDRGRVVPAVLERNRRVFFRRVGQLRQFTRRIHIDVTDGQFVRSRTVGGPSLRRLPRPSQYQYHFMVRRPERWVRRVRLLRGDEVVFHIESSHLASAIARARQRGASVGLAVNPNTPLVRLRPWRQQIDTIVCLGVSPGAQGQPLVPSTLRRVRTLRRWGQPIAVDGGIRLETARLVCRAGAAELIVGSAIVHAAKPAAAWRAISRQAKVV